MLAQNPHKEAEAANPSPFYSTQGLLFHLRVPLASVLRTCACFAFCFQREKQWFLSTDYKD